MLFYISNKGMSKARLALIVGILSISVYPVIIKLNPAPSLISAFYRMAIAAALLIPYVLITKQFKIVNLKSTLIAVASGLFIAADVSMWNFAIKESSATQATLLVNLAPIWVGIGAYLFLKHNPTRNFWIGAMVAFIGMMVMIGLKTIFKLEFDRALVLGIAAGVCYAGYILTSKRALNQMDLLSFFSVSLLSSSIFLGVLNVGLGTPFVGFSASTWSLLIIQGIFSQLMAWMLINYAIKRMRATRVSLSLLSQAFFSSLLAWFFLKEEITLNMIIGGLILLGGIAITFIPRKDELKS